MNSFYETTDLPAAAILVAMGIDLEALNRSDPGRVRFVFRRVEGLDDLLSSYWKKDLRVEPLSFISAQKYLKTRLYADAN